MPSLKRLFVVLPLAFAAALGAIPARTVTQAQAQRPCSRCNVVAEGVWNDGLVNQTVYLYSRSDNQFYPVIVTGVHREGPFYVIRWRDPNSSRQGKDDATNYYSYQSMREMTSGGQSRPPLSQSENQERNGWLASCAMYESDDAAMRFLGRRGCCESTAAKRYGPYPRCI